MPTNARALRFPPLLRLLCVCAPLLMGGCGLLRGSAPAVDRTQDARIRQEIEARLLREPSLDAELIRVEVDGRTVLLYGSVRGMAAWKCALRNAELVPGVSTVVDYLILERGPREAPCQAPAPTVQRGAAQGR